MAKETGQANLNYQSPYAIELTKGERWTNFWNRKVAEFKGADTCRQIGLLPTGEKGEFNLVLKGTCALHD